MSRTAARTAAVAPALNRLSRGSTWPRSGHATSGLLDTSVLRTRAKLIRSTVGRRRSQHQCQRRHVAPVAPESRSPCVMAPVDLVDSAHRRAVGHTLWRRGEVGWMPARSDPDPRRWPPERLRARRKQSTEADLSASAASAVAEPTRVRPAFAGLGATRLQRRAAALLRDDKGSLAGSARAGRGAPPGRQWPQQFRDRRTTGALPRECRAVPVHELRHARWSRRAWAASSNAYEHHLGSPGRGRQAL